MIGMFYHVMTHLSSQWRMSYGPFGWWAWTEFKHGGIGFGIIGHVLAYWTKS